MAWNKADYDAQAVLWQLALGWSVLTFVILLLIAIILDVFRIRLLDSSFRKWIYGVFLVGLLGGISARFLDLIKIDPYRAAIEVSPKALDQAAQEAYSPPPPTPPLPPAPATAVNISAYHVYIQFSGVLRREDIIGLAKTLTTAGWKVEGADRGGERTAAASGYNEVRYSGDNDAVAKELARQVQSAGLTGKNVTISRSNSIGLNNLEIWISR